MIAHALRDAIDALAAMPGARLGVIAGERDGLVVHASGAERDRAPAVAALLASLHRKARAAASADARGDTKLVRLEAAEGEILTASSGEFVVMVVAARGANLGRLRLGLLSATRAAAE